MRLRAIVLFSAVFTLLFTSFAFAKDKSENPRTRGPVRLTKYADATGPTETVLNINSLESWVATNGFFDAIVGGGWNGSYPRGTQVGVIFREGIVWGVKVTDDEVLRVRVGGSSQSNGLNGGKAVGYVANPYSAPTGWEDPSPSAQQVWRVRTDWETADLKIDAASFNLTAAGSVTETEIAAIKAQYSHDWDHWPAAAGAPFEDVDGNGSYDPAVDVPGFPGASQTLWFVSNDLDGDVNAVFAGSPSIGIEMQMTLWAYDFPQTSPLGNMSFKRVRLIYTGRINGPSDARIDTMYVTQWADPDLGDFGDDFVGTDVETSLGYIYNANTRDNVYFGDLGIAVPAAGYDFLQGPINADGDTLGMSSFTFFGAGGDISDPDRGIYSGTLQWFNLMEGFLPRPEYPEQELLLDPITGETTKFWVNGDPVAGTGWVDGIILPPGDRRLLLTTGPFEMALGDTQDIVIAFVAGIGLDNISSITVMRFHDSFAQFAFDQKFDLPSPPSAPSVTSAELDKRIVLNWGDDLAAIAATEETVVSGFVFEGYNVYQLPTTASSLADGKRVATFDVRNLIQTIFDPGVDPVSGFVISQAKQFGTNSGIQRFFSTDQDKIRNRPMSNGVTYVFAVTAYSFLADNVGKPFKTLESSPVLFAVTPQEPAPGTAYESTYGKLVEITHASGVSDGIIRATVIDPTKTTGHAYEVTFAEDTDTESATFGEIVWTLVDKTSGQTLLSNQPQSPDIDADLTMLVIDGLHIQVQGPPFEFLGGGGGIIEIANPAGDPCGPDASSTGGCDAYGGNTVWHSGNSTGDYYVSATGSGAISRMERYATFAVPRDFELRFTDTGGWGVWAFEDDKIGTVPFELWDIGIATPDDASDDVRMVPFLLSNDGTADAWGYATGVDGTFGFPTSDAFYWMDPEGTDGYDKFAAICAGLGAGGSYPWDTDGSIDGYWADFHGGFVYPIGRTQIADLAQDGTPPPTGTVIRFLTTKTIAIVDVYNFTSPAVTTGDAVSTERMLIRSTYIPTLTTVSMN
ncbi:MAG: hypothetical protein IID12_06415 [Candidatus Marinimicrobia bacterium]|nr:hypothetical protein [Candidatus Neomarinimicrobiota bacterium]